MDFSEIMNIALPIVYVLVGVALIWLIIELVRTLRKTRKTVDELQKQVQPTLEHVEAITAQLQPVMGKIDPLMERVSLTVDAANLEIMRLDQILEDVSEITESVSGTVTTVNNVANLPLDVVNSMSEKVRGFLSPKKASDESVALGQGKADKAAEFAEAEVAEPEEAFEPEPVGASTDETVPMGAVAAEVAEAAAKSASDSKYYTY